MKIKYFARLSALLLVIGSLFPASASAGIADPVVDTLYDTIRVNVCHARAYNGYGFTLDATETSILGRVVSRTRSFTSTDGVDSSLTLEATVVASPTASISGANSICQGGSTVLTASGDGSFKWSNGSTETAITVYMAGTYEVKCVAENGCADSARITVTVRQPIINEVMVNLCVGDSVRFIDTLIFDAGRYTRWLKTEEGNCDSLYAMYVESRPLPVVRITGDVDYCYGSAAYLTANGADQYRWQDGVRGATYALRGEGEFSVVGTTVYGCEGRDTVFVRQHPLYDTNVYATICSGQSVSFYQRELRSTGTFSHTDHSIYGCDSVIHMNVTVNQPSNVAITVYTTDRYVWADSVYREWGQYFHTFTNVYGCDSNVTLSLGIIEQKPVPQIVSFDDRLLMVDHYPGGTDSARVDYLAYRWARNGSYIAGANSDEYRLSDFATMKGCYRVEAQTDSIHWVPSNTICINDSYVFNGIDDVSALAESISLYPNPVAAGASIRLTMQDGTYSLADANVEIFDAAGRRIAFVENITNERISAPAMPGLYLVRLLWSDGRMAAKKISVR